MELVLFTIHRLALSISHRRTIVLRRQHYKLGMVSFLASKLRCAQTTSRAQLGAEAFLFFEPFSHRCRQFRKNRPDLLPALLAIRTRRRELALAVTIWDGTRFSRPRRHLDLDQQVESRRYTLITLGDVALALTFFRNLSAQTLITWAICVPRPPALIYSVRQR